MMGLESGTCRLFELGLVKNHLLKLNRGLLLKAEVILILIAL